MKISVITAVYNNHATLADALDSALAQDYPDVELEVGLIRPPNLLFGARW